MVKKLGIIVQRYGREINGGAEYHARLIAEKLAPYFSIEVFTSTALDYITWEHHYPEGTEQIHQITVNRFAVKKERDPALFGMIQDKVFNMEHTLEDEFFWLEAEGPYLPQLIGTLENRQNEFDYYIFFSYRYFHAYQGITRFKKKSILVPTAEHDQVIYMRLFKELFHLPAAIVYNSVEEKELINTVAQNEHIPGDIVGVGSELPAQTFPQTFISAFKLSRKYLIYIGRLDENKGVPELLNFFLQFITETKLDIDLVLIGKSHIPIPNHPHLVYLGFQDDSVKYNALAGAECLIIPSQYESLSMVALEAWGLGKPVIANGRTDVLRGQCQRSNAGLWYTNYQEFKEILLLIFQDPLLLSKLGQNGLKFFQANYTWPVIINKYLALLKQLETF
jgi:glycosyltransferase involved in cell wall biosynthesis